jgi:hypothetical protein
METVNGVSTNFVTGSVTCQASGTYTLNPAASSTNPRAAPKEKETRTK